MPPQQRIRHELCGSLSHDNDDDCRVSRIDGPLAKAIEPTAFDARLADLAGRQHGVATVAQMREFGLGPRGVQHRAARGKLHRVHRGVYAVGHARLSGDGTRMAAVLACGDRALLSHLSAAVIWGLMRSASGRYHVTTPDRGRKSSPGLIVHRTRHIAADESAILRGIPVTSVARTLVDLAGMLTPDRLAQAVHQAEVLRLLDTSEVLAALDRAASKRGTRALRTVLTEPSPGLTRNAFEQMFLEACRAGGLPMPTVNTFVDKGDRLTEVDALWSAERVIIELDGAAAHHTRRAFHEDRRRDFDFAARGYVVVRVTWQRMTSEPQRVISDLDRLLTLRRATLPQRGGHR